MFSYLALTINVCNPVFETFAYYSILPDLPDLEEEKDLEQWNDDGTTENPERFHSVRTLSTEISALTTNTLPPQVHLRSWSPPPQA